ncbi:MAG: cytochrome c biogenesis CcdA family protein [Ilumatobacteraceae bacterium]
MFSGPFALALTAGMAATVNPCGFALLPAYLSAFIGMQDGGTMGAAVGRAIGVSLVLTAGFVTVFGLFGIILSPVLGEIQEYAPWFTVVFGVALVGLGAWLVTGHQLVVKIPKLERGGADGTLVSMYLFGISYAVASLSCAIPNFLLVTSGAANEDSFASRLLTFVLYGVGMGVIVTVLTIAVAFARSGVVARFRALIPKMNLVAGVLLLVAGAYVAYYGWYELRVFHFGGSVEDPVVDRASAIQSWLVRRMPTTDNYGWYLGVAAAAIAGSVVWSRRRPSAAE